LAKEFAFEVSVAAASSGDLGPTYIGQAMAQYVPTNFLRKDIYLERDQDGAEVRSARKARGAEPGPSVRNVLVWSLGLVVVAFAVVYFLFFKI
jgi:hypothetical protein